MPQKGFLSSLFDLSFRSLIATRVIRALYALTLTGIGLVAALWVLRGFHAGPALGVLALVAAPLVALAVAVYARFLLEFAVAVFRILEASQELVLLERERDALGPSAG